MTIYDPRKFFGKAEGRKDPCRLTGCLLSEGHEGNHVFPATRAGGGGDDLKRAQDRELEDWMNPRHSSGTFNTPRLTDGKGNVITSGGGEAPRVYVRKDCVHDGSVPSFELKDGRRIYGARGGSLIKMNHLDLVLDLAGFVKAPRDFLKAPVPRRFLRLKAAQGPEIVTFNWPDMSAPTHVGFSFWEALHEMLPGDTCIACVGSHGRTGTAMACILVADGMPPDQAIATVREKHCRHAIETAPQEHYIRSLR